LALAVDVFSQAMAGNHFLRNNAMNLAVEHFEMRSVEHCEHA